MSIVATIAELAEHDGQEVTLQGWLSGRRSGGKVLFLQVRDGTGRCQCVIEASETTAFERAKTLPLESSLQVTGSVRKDDRATGGYEAAITSIDILHTAEDYPISRKAHGVDFLMSHRHLWLRSQRQTAILRIRHTIIKACRDFFDSRKFTLIDTPILTSGAGEDDQTLFPVRYFDREVFLTQTGQLHLESACMALRKVYCFGPTFRAEKSKTRRHLTEFWMIEPEIAFAELDDVIELAEDLICEVVTRVLARHEADLTSLGRDLDPLRKVQKPFPKLTYTDAVENLKSKATRERLETELTADREQLQTWANELADLETQLAEATKQWRKEKLQTHVHTLREQLQELEADVANRPEHIQLAQSFEWGKDLGGSDETILSRQFEQPLFVTHYPREAKAFYMKKGEDPKTVRNMDLLAPEGYGEIIGGSQREDNLAVLEDRMREKGLAPEDYGWYLDLRRYGSVPHGGFGLGIERTIAWICGLKHVRETIPFPRTIGRVEP